MSGIVGDVISNVKQDNLGANTNAFGCIAAVDIRKLTAAPKKSLEEICGERGIRTLGTVTRTTVFETVPFNHSGISPQSVADQAQSKILLHSNLVLYLRKS